MMNSQFNTRVEYLFLVKIRSMLASVSDRSHVEYAKTIKSAGTLPNLKLLYQEHKQELERLMTARQRSEDNFQAFVSLCKNQMTSLKSFLDKSGVRELDKELTRRICLLDRKDADAVLIEDDEDDDDDYDDDDDDDYEEEEDQRPMNDAQRARNMLMIVLGGKHNRMPDTRGMSAQAKKFFDLLKRRSGKTDLSSDKYFASLTDDQKDALVKELTTLTDISETQPMLYRILFSKIPPHMKNEIMNRIENGRDHENQKYTTWLDGLLRLPLGKCATPHYADPKLKKDTKAACAFLDKAKAQLDAAVYGHEPAKHKLMQFISQRIQNNTSDGMVLGIQGPYGNGKTTLIEKGVSAVMGLPFVAIPLGGATDASFLNGHGFTYEGSVWGQIANVLMTAKVSNPIIYLDELDKISDTPKGREVADQLVHLVDPSQNKHFQDRYFHGLDIDLSKVTWIFSYNDASRIHPVLRDRITAVHTKGFTTPEKLKITTQFLIPNIAKEVGISPSLFSIQDEVLEHIITRYTFEGGVRKLKECLFDIVRDLNMDGLRGDIVTVPNKRRRRGGAESGRATENYCYDVTIKSLREKFLKHLTEITTDVVHAVPEVGRINGLYACSNDMGGITPIETHLVPSDVTFGLALTGNLGKVMKESAEVAKTLAWRFITPERQSYWFAKWKEGKASVHIHCPEGAMSKDGPSAGTALTTCILSMLTGNVVRNDVSITGEINLSGAVMPIGGLRSKLFGAKAAKCRLALFPKDNMQDYEKIVEECPYLFDDSFQAIPIEHLTDALKHLLISHEHIISTKPAPESAVSDPVKAKAAKKGTSAEPLKMKGDPKTHNLRSRKHQ